MRKRKTIKVGQKVMFDPLRYEEGLCALDICPEYFVGVITNIYSDRRWFLVEYVVNDVVLHMGFKFDEFGIREKNRKAAVIPVNTLHDELAVKHYLSHGKRILQLIRKGN